MKTKKYLYSLAASALFLSGAYAADTELVLDDSQDGLTWTDALWSNGVPNAETETEISIADNTYPLIIDSIAKSGNLTVKNNSYLLLTGEGNSLTLSAQSDVVLQNNSKMVVSNGAVLSIPKYENSQYSLKVTDNSSFEVDGATFTGQFYGEVNNAVIKNSSTWNMAGFGNMWDVNLQVVDSTINQTASVGFGNGQREGNSKVVTLQNSTWKTNGQGVSLAGIVNVYDSAITGGVHFNIGQDAGNANNENTITFRGSSSESIASLYAYNLYYNTNGGNTSTTLHQAGNSNITFSKFVSGNVTNGGGNVLWLFSGDNNTTTLTNSQDSSWGDNDRNNNTTGIWKITNAQTVDGVETFSTNSTFNVHSIYMKVSSVEGNDFQTIVDWAGKSNTFKTSYDVFPCLSTGANTNAVSSFTVRDGALADISAFVVVGGKVDASLSGTASFNVLNDATYNQKSHIVLQNSTVAGSTGRSEFNFENANWNRTGGSLLIGFGSNSRNDNPNQDAISGTSIATIKDSIITYGGNIALAGSSVDLSESKNTHTNLAKLVIENTQFTFSGELYLGHSGYNGGTIYGGTSIIEVTGENSAFISSNKGLYSGYGTTTYGGERKILVSGKNNTVSFGSDGAFHMNSSNYAKQYGGSFEVNIQGEGHTFQTGNKIDMGMKDAVGGSNTFYVKGTSSANKNKVFVDGGEISIKASSNEESTIVNTMELAGNTILSKSDGGRINFLLSSYDSAVAGTAKFIISGENNEVYLNNFAVGKVDLDSGSVLLQIEGSTHNISAVNFAMRTSGLNTQAATLSFVSDSVGISTLKTTSVNELSGFIDVDFSKYVAQSTDPMQFILISSENNWDGSNYETDRENDYIKVSLANENDTWRTFMEGNNLVLEYTSAVIPEPSTFAAIFGAIALAFAAYRRKKQ